MIEAFFAMVTNNLLVPGFAAGMVVGAVLLYYAMAKAWVTPPQRYFNRVADLQKTIGKLNAGIAELQAENRGLQEQLAALRTEFQAFAKWRRDLVGQALEETKDGSQ